MASVEGAKNPIVLISTSSGDVRAEIFVDQAPITAQNFLNYVEEKFYHGLIFHRVIRDFMIQGGGFDPQMRQRPAKGPIKNEAANGLKNDTGTLAMARTSVVDSATCQFFINVRDNDFLNHRDASPAGFGYAVFGRVVGGMEVVKKIAQVETGNVGMHGDVPLEPVVIHSMQVEG